MFGLKGRGIKNKKALGTEILSISLVHLNNFLFSMHEMRTNINVNIYIYIDIYVCIYINMHIYVNTYIYIYIHIENYICLQAL